jgi:hypothetical protein
MILQSRVSGNFPPAGQMDAIASSGVARAEVNLLTKYVSR